MHPSPLMIIYVCRNGVEIGQYTRQDFEYLLSRDRLFHTDHFWSEGMEEWKPLSAAKSYLCQREKCRHCGAKMSEQKPVTSGARVGQMKCSCRKCGHTEYHAAAETADEEPAPESEAQQAEPPPECEPAHEAGAAEIYASGAAAAAG